MKEKNLKQEDKRKLVNNIFKYIWEILKRKKALLGWTEKGKIILEIKNSTKSFVKQVRTKCIKWPFQTSAWERRRDFNKKGNELSDKSEKKWDGIGKGRTEIFWGFKKMCKFFD